MPVSKAWGCAPMHNSDIPRLSSTRGQRHSQGTSPPDRGTGHISFITMLEIRTRRRERRSAQDISGIHCCFRGCLMQTLGMTMSCSHI